MDKETRDELRRIERDANRRLKRVESEMRLIRQLLDAGAEMDAKLEDQSAAAFSAVALLDRRLRAAGSQGPSAVRILFIEKLDPESNGGRLWRIRNYPEAAEELAPEELKAALDCEYEEDRLRRSFRQEAMRRYARLSAEWLEKKIKEEKERERLEKEKEREDEQLRF